MADSTLELIIDVNDANQAGLYQDFLTSTRISPSDMVRGDKTLAVTIRPVHSSATNTEPGGRPWDDDYASGDSFILAIGLADQVPTGGTFKLTISASSTGLTLLAYNISAANLQTPLSAASVTQGYGTLTVTNPVAGVYVVTWSTPNTLVPAIVADATNLLPNCEIIVSVIKAGNETATTVAQQIIAIRQQNVALSQPAVALPAAGVTVTYDQVASATQNSIARISFDAPGTYAGLYSISAVAGGESAACGQAKPLFTTMELGQVLAQHPQIIFNDTVETNNIIVSKDGADFVIEFTNNLSGASLTKTLNSATVANPSVITTTANHNYRTGDSVTISASSGTTPSLNGTYTITVISATTFSIPLNVTVSSGATGTIFNNSESKLTASNVSLLAPTGLSGTIDLNTYNLASAFWATTADTLTFEISVERTRTSGEIRTLLLTEIVLKRDIIDVTSLVPTPIPSNLTQYTGVNFNGGINSLDSGGAVSLNSIVTVNLSTPLSLYFISAGQYGLSGGVTFTLKSGASADSPPTIKLPLDYNAGTNAKYWEAES
jgi:hypothetical protein